MFVRGTQISNLVKKIVSISATDTQYQGVRTCHLRGYHWVLSAAGLPSRDRPSICTTGNNGPTATNTLAGIEWTRTCHPRGHKTPNLFPHARHPSELRPSSSLSPLTTTPSGPSIPETSPVRQLYSSASPPGMYTTSFAFFEALWEAGITHVFVNLGSDHPSIIEAMVKGQREKEDNFPRIITCPNEVGRQSSS